jgi:hypothetical protein
MRTLIAALLLALPCLADEVVCKDGRRIEFRSVEDTGETYTIVTPEGGRVVVKRSDVDSFAKTEPAVALTGAAMTFDKKSKLDAVDLLKKIDLGKDALDGTWKFAPSGVLTGSSTSAARLQIRYAPPEEYNLTVTLERTEGDDNIGICLVTPGGLAMYHLDVDRGAYHGLLAPEGSDGHRKVTSTSGKVLAPGKPRTLVFMVRRASLVVQLDGRDVCTSRVDWSKVVPLPGVAPADRPAFGLFALKSGISVSRLSLSFPSGKDK